MSLNKYTGAVSLCQKTNNLDQSAVSHSDYGSLILQTGYLSLEKEETYGNNKERSATE